MESLLIRIGLTLAALCVTNAYRNGLLDVVPGSLSLGVMRKECPPAPEENAPPQAAASSMLRSTVWRTDVCQVSIQTVIPSYLRRKTPTLMIFHWMTAVIIIAVMTGMIITIVLDLEVELVAVVVSRHS